jgi:8-oxo-dGTP diphosphatase
MSSRFLNLVVAAVTFDEDRILVTQRLSKGRFADLWEFPGGKLEWGESPEAGLAREIREELGVAIEIGDPLHVIHYALDDTQAFAVIFYSCRLTGGDIACLGIQDYRWIRADEFDTIEFLPTNLPVVELLQKRFGNK